MAKKILAVALIAIVAVSAAACFAACEEEPTPYADLVAVRVNNFMAEWENIDYNFTYEGSSALKVSVPYTNYLEVNDLIVSPGAEYKVYEDEGKTKQLTDLSKIYVDGTKTLYIDVTNGELSNSYSVDVTVEQTNLPPESEIADKQYDNRGGHIYIPEGAETVMIDGVEYTVQRERCNPIINENIILAEDAYCFHTDGSDYSAIFNGNGYEVQLDAPTIFVNTLADGGVVKNVTFSIYRQSENAGPLDLGGIIAGHGVCLTNNGIIENVKTKIRYKTGGGLDATLPSETPITLGYFARENNGEIRNCLNVGEIASQFNTTNVQMGSFAIRQYGTLYNCVNTAPVQHEFIYKEDKVSGAGAIAFETSADAVYKGVFNTGECIHGEIEEKYLDKKLNGLFFRTRFENGYPDMGRIKNYK